MGGGSTVFWAEGAKCLKNLAGRRETREMRPVSGRKAVVEDFGGVEQLWTSSEW